MKSVWLLWFNPLPLVYSFLVCEILYSVLLSFWGLDRVDIEYFSYSRMDGEVQMQEIHLELKNNYK